MTDSYGWALTIDEATLNFQAIASLLILSVAPAACGATVVDLDSAVIEASTAPGVLAIVHERIQKLTVDDERLYWFGTYWPKLDQGSPWRLHSCLKRNCPTTLVTYDSGPSDTSVDFTVRGDQIYWHRRYPSQLLSCRVAGCNGAPGQLATVEPYTVTPAFHDKYLYYFDASTLKRLSVLEPAPHESIAETPGIPLKLTIQGEYAYWMAINTPSDNKSTILRARTDGSSGAEIVVSNLNISLYRPFGLTTDETSIYWTNNALGGSLDRCPLSGCIDDSEALLTRLRAPQNLLIDGARLYYQYEAEPYEYVLSSCIASTCAASPPLGEHLDSPGVLALDDHHLYVSTTEQDLSPDNVDAEIVVRIRSLPKPDQESP